MDDEEIIVLYLQNTLTAVAKEVIHKIMVSRGLPQENKELERLLDEVLSQKSLAEEALLVDGNTINQSNNWWDKSFFGTLSMGLVVVTALSGVALSIIIGELGYWIACSAAWLITPFGLIFGLIGMRKDEDNDKAGVGIFLNILLFLIATIFHPLSLIGGHNLH